MVCVEVEVCLRAAPTMNFDDNGEKEHDIPSGYRPAFAGYGGLRDGRPAEPRRPQ